MLSNQWLNEITPPALLPKDQSGNDPVTGFSKENQDRYPVTFVTHENGIGGERFAENDLVYPDIDPHAGFVKVIIPPFNQSIEPPHRMREYPQGDRVRCADCRHVAPAADPAAWRRCRAGERGDFGFALIFCEKWEEQV